MNYYNYHIGDFNNATRHLTRVERSLYRDLIDVYYDTEHALNGSDFDRLARRVLANSEEEKKALKDVLDEFFTLCDDHYHNERCDKEIAKYHANTESKRKAGKASAASRQQKTTRVEHVLNECATNQEPITNNQELKPFVKHEKIVFDGSSFQNINGQLNVWRAAYPAIDIDIEIRKAAAWLNANPKNKKSQYARFINAWLARAQDSAPRVTSNPKDQFRGVL